MADARIPSRVALQFRERIGSVLQRQRLRRGLTQADVSEDADISLKYLGQIERGEANVSIDLIARVGEVVGLPQDDLLCQSQEPLGEGVRLLLIDEVQKMREQLASMQKWLQAIDPALHPKPKRHGSTETA